MANADFAHFKFMTPLDYVKDRKRTVADAVEDQVFITRTKDTILQVNSLEFKDDKFYSTHSSQGFQTNTKRFRDKLERGDVKITDEMAFPPTIIYMPSPDLLTFMINRASKALRMENGKFGFIF